jgi:rhodanese-related sulfurtransferase
MEASTNTPKTSTALRMAVMLIAAVVIGLAYNSVTPLGVVFGAKPAMPNDSKSAPSVQTDGIEQSQLIQISLATDGIVGNRPILFGKGSKNLSWPETQSLLAANEIVLVDARNAIDYQTEHIPGAVSLPATSSEAEVAAFAAKYPRDTALVLYCGSKMCPMSHNLAKELRSKKWGYTNVRIMPGGFAEYRASKATVQR